MTTTHSTNRKKLWVGLLAVALVGLGVGAWMHHHSDHAAGHDHGSSGSAALSLDDGKRWATDAPLREGMTRIRDATNAFVLTRTGAGVDARAAASLTTAINENVNFLIAKCKLAPEADAVLHVLITNLLSGAAILSTGPEPLEGLDQITTALRQYPEYFDHPQWKALDMDGT